MLFFSAKERSGNVVANQIRFKPGIATLWRAIVIARCVRDYGQLQREIPPRDMATTLIKFANISGSVIFKWQVLRSERLSSCRITENYA